ncbi:MAG: hypothetical protein JNL06_14380 [Alphaproteobacteria bacterium]|nr:hypothetical protein [Alphaproteobacteria bacterium]
MKIHCTCGATIHDGADDLPHRAHIIPDQRWNRLFEDIDELIENQCATSAQRNAACTKIRAMVLANVRLAWQCRSCGRIYADDAKAKLSEYVAAEGASHHLFSA